ncbi:MAG: hypothetical protein ACKPKO_27680, partial [Candidatus Fonsibacter sp.]
MMIDYFKTNRSLQDQFTWQYIETLQWQVDESCNGFITAGSLSLQAWLLRSLKRSCGIRSSRRYATLKRLQADLQEFDRMREDDPRRTLKWMTEK